MTDLAAALICAEELLRRAAKVVAIAPETPKFAAELTTAADELEAARTLPPANTEADVERVAREILKRHVHPKVFADGWPLHLDDVLRAIRDALTKPPALPKEGEEAIRARAFEEAARVAEHRRDNAGGCSSYRLACGHVAEGIRALSSLPVRSGEVERLREALRLAEVADKQRDHCEECNGEDLAELCPKCFPSADAARLARWEALGISRAALATPQQVKEGGR